MSAAAQPADSASSGSCMQAHTATVRRYGANARVLELGCGNLRFSLKEHLPQEASRFCGIDIAAKAIAAARSAVAGMAQCEVARMDAQELNFPAGSFDLVFGRGILHHLDLGKALAGIARVLRPGGKAVFEEPLRFETVPQGLRPIVTHPWIADGRPLTPADLALAKTFFSNVDYTLFGKPPLRWMLRSSVLVLTK